ncbi:MAG: toxin-antitoxin system YwqK family antitoxin [Bacteroidales bacterium]
MVNGCRSGNKVIIYSEVLSGLSSHKSDHYDIPDTLVNCNFELYDILDSSTLILSGRFCKSKKCSVWKEFYRNGQIRSKIKYKNNLVDGTCKEWYPSGKIKIVWIVKDSNNIKVKNCYDPDGKKITIGEMRDMGY